MPLKERPDRSAPVVPPHTHGPQTDPSHDINDDHSRSHLTRPPRPAPHRAVPLSGLRPGEWGVVAAVGGEGALRRRLLDMGLTPRTRVLLRKSAPLGDPLELFLRGYSLSLRRAEAESILVLPDGAAGANEKGFSV